MKFGALTLFQQIHGNGKKIPAIVIASWHWKWSLTWRWGLSWHKDKAMIGGKSKYGRNGECIFIRVMLGPFGGLAFDTQRNMRWNKS